MKTFGVFLMPSCNFMLTYISIQSKTNKNKETDGSKQQQKTAKNQLLLIQYIVVPYWCTFWIVIYGSQLLCFVLLYQNDTCLNVYIHFEIMYTVRSTTNFTDS